MFHPYKYLPLNYYFFGYNLPLNFNTLSRKYFIFVFIYLLLVIYMLISILIWSNKVIWWFGWRGIAVGVKKKS